MAILVIILLAGWGIYSLLTPARPAPVESAIEEFHREQVALSSVRLHEKPDS